MINNWTVEKGPEGKRRACKGTDGPVRGTEGSVTGTRPLLIVQIRKILVSVKFVSTILGPEMGVPILWTLGKCVLSAGKPIFSIKFLVLGGGSAGFIFMGARIFRNKTQEDVNGEKLTVKKWWIFGADFFTVYAEFFTAYKGHKR